MPEINQIIEALVKFRDDRNWEQFHNTKDLSMAISIEAAELNELFLWKTIEECKEVDREMIAEELADIFAFAFLLAHKHGFDVTWIRKWRGISGGGFTGFNSIHEIRKLPLFVDAILGTNLALKWYTFQVKSTIS